MTANDFERRLVAGLAVEVPDEAVRRLDDKLAARLRPRRLPAIRGWRLAGVVAMLAIAAPLAAVVTAGIPHTEDPFGVIDAAGFQAEIDAAKQAVPLPAGAQWPAYVDVQDHDAGYSRRGGRFQVEGIAFCLWMGSWLGAVDAGDRATAEAARATILAVPTWTLYTSPFADQSYRDVLDRILAGVESNDSIVARDASRPACP